MRRWIVGLACLALAAESGAAARPRAVRASTSPRYLSISEVRPSRAHLADPLLYHGAVIVSPGVRVRWVAPRSDSEWTWGSLRPWHHGAEDGSSARGRTIADTFHAEVPLQAWTTGVRSVPGLTFEIEDRSRGARAVNRLPPVRITIEAVIPAGDTSAQLHPLRGPLAAPWWEKVPWRWVIAGLALLLAVILLWRWLARRRRAARPAGPASAPLLDPVQQALAELASLRGLHLPEQGRFGEHAFHLTRIARQFLESAAGTPRPGDTTPELIARLPGAGLGPEDQGTLAGLLRSWDLVKFARVGSSREEAARAESSLESFVRRWAEARAGDARVA